jgi:hypothetical protein
MNVIYLIFGITFGFLLSRARVTEYDAIISMFRLMDLHVAGVIVVAIAVAAVGLYMLRRNQAKALIGCDIEVRPKPTHPGMITAGLLFGVGWALTGA